MSEKKGEIDLINASKAYEKEIENESKAGELYRTVSRETGRGIERLEGNLFEAAQKILLASTELRAIYNLIKEEAKDPKTRVGAIKKMRALRDYKLYLLKLEPYINLIVDLQRYKVERIKDQYHSNVSEISTIENELEKMVEKE